MESTNGNSIFKNYLITKRIFKNLDTKSIKNCRLLCRNPAEVGAQIFANYRNPLYFKIYESSWYNQKIIDKHNNEKLEWLETQLEKDQDFWVMKSMEIPFFDWENNSTIRNFMTKNGHLLKDLRLVNQRRREKYSEVYCDKIYTRESDFLWKVLTQFCPNLKRVKVFDALRNSGEREDADYDENIFKIDLPPEIPLEYLSLVYDPHVYDNNNECNDPPRDHGEDGLPMDLKWIITDILKSCSNLKVLKLVPFSREDGCLNPILRSIHEERKVLKSLEALDLGPRVNGETLGFITENVFPRLITLQLRTITGYLKYIPNREINDSPKTLKTLILSVRALIPDEGEDNDENNDEENLLEVANVLKRFPSVENLEISFIEEGARFKPKPRLPLNVYASADNFQNVKSFTSIAPFDLNEMNTTLEAIFNLFPNLEKLSIVALPPKGWEGDINFAKLGKFDKLKELRVMLGSSIAKDWRQILSEENVRAICPTLRKISFDVVDIPWRKYPHVLHPLDYTDLKQVYFG